MSCRLALHLNIDSCDLQSQDTCMSSKPSWVQLLAWQGYAQVTRGPASETGWEIFFSFWFLKDLGVG